MKNQKEKDMTKWTLDPIHSEISFKVRHLMISHVRGLFKRFDASIYTHEKDFTTAEVDLWIDANSIDTGNPQRDTHLKSKDFLDVANHKQITFTSSTMGNPDAEGVQLLWGELTMVGITKKIALKVEFGGIRRDPYGNEKAGFSISGKFNRTHWELGWNSALEAGGVMVGEEITISCEIELTNSGIQSQKMVLEGNGVQELRGN